MVSGDTKNKFLSVNINKKEVLTMFLARNLKSALKILLFTSILMFIPMLLGIDCSIYAVRAEEVVESIVWEDYHDFEHHTGEKPYKMKDIETEEQIMKTSRRITEGDRYITQDNKFYYVENVEENIAWARLWGTTELSPIERAAPDRSSIIDILTQYETGEVGETEQVQPEEQQIEPEEAKVAVFHSHGAEAYVPSDGDEFIEEGGGILDVGETFSEELQKKGIDTIHNTETHVPHDAGAYQRSRGTKEELIKENANVFFDVHRDAVPGEEYIEHINGEPIVQVQFVVGRQNQNVQTIREFAESMKRAADEQHPGLVKGIFFAQGNYNQDMHPQSLLLEIGSHENTREGAEESAALFADAVEYYYVEEETAARGGIAMAVLRSILWIIFIALLALGAFLLISTGGREEFRAKVKRFFSREFSEFRGGRGNRDNQ